MHMKDELEREHERKMTEMREAARRMKDDCSHQVEMERFIYITQLSYYVWINKCIQLECHP